MKKSSISNKDKEYIEAKPSCAPNFRDLIESAAHGVLIYRNFKPLYVNEKFAETYGYESPQEILSLPLIKPLIPADRWAQVEEEYNDLMRGIRQPMMMRVRGMRKDGREIWVALTERIIDWDKAPAVVVTTIDITAHMATEEALLENEQKLHAILEVLPYPIYITRLSDGKLFFVNRKTCLMFQKSAGQLLRGTSLDFYANPKERDDLRKLLDSIPDIRDIEVQMKTSTGREFTAEVAAIRMNYDGSPAALVALNDISRRKEMEAELVSQATTDELTGINNRRNFFVEAERELGRALRFKRPLSAMMIDIDFFKSVNDKYGHAVGDDVLKAFVRRALESLRTSDIIGRLGGEEFAVIMPETSREAAEAAAERLRFHVADRPLIGGREAIAVTTSIGIATLHKEDASVDILLGRADKALYRAKHGGRNRVESAEGKLETHPL
jgi:diguanylate cyclase (GGDEF)-like protein/PAS domain S-box-containing protein